MRFPIILLGLAFAAGAQQIPDSVSVSCVIVYAQYGEAQLRLDLYRPRNGEPPLPGVIAVRGGGWRAGDKRGFASIAAALAEQGWAVACIE